MVRTISTAAEISDSEVTSHLNGLTTRFGLISFSPIARFSNKSRSRATMAMPEAPALANAVAIP